MTVRAVASGSKGNCYVIAHDGSRLMIECGLPYREIQRAMGFDYSDLAACLVSHEHKDHSKCAKELSRAGVLVLSSMGTMTAVGAGKPIMPKAKYDIPPFNVRTFPVVHDAADPIGFIVSAGNDELLYLTDTMYSPHRFTEKFTHLMIECNYSLDVLREREQAGKLDKSLKHRVMYSHMEIRTAMNLIESLDRSRLREIHLLHLSDANSDAEAFRAEAERKFAVPVYIA